MFKRIWTFIKKDFVTALRDNISLYVLLFPLITAGVIALILPSFESGNITFAVNYQKVDEEIIKKLDDFGIIEEYGKESSGDAENIDEKLEERVKKFDDTVGITKENDKYKVILEGNETGEAVEIVNMIMDYILAKEKIAEYKYENLGKKKTFVKEFMTCILIISSFLMAGMVESINIVDEKEFKSINALAVSPLSMFEYIISRGFVILIIGLFLGIANSLILLGFSVNYLYIVIGLIASALLGIFIAFFIGGFANNQLTVIAILKVFALVYTGIPIASIFLDHSWHWLFYIFPNYWSFNIFRNIFIAPQPVNFWWSVILTVISSMVFIIILIPFLRKTLKLRN